MGGATALGAHSRSNCCVFAADQASGVSSVEPRRLIISSRNFDLYPPLQIARRESLLSSEYAEAETECKCIFKSIGANGKCLPELGELTSDSLQLVRAALGNS